MERDLANAANIRKAHSCLAPSTAWTRIQASGAGRTTYHIPERLSHAALRVGPLDRFTHGGLWGCCRLPAATRIFGLDLATADRLGPYRPLAPGWPFLYPDLMKWSVTDSTPRASMRPTDKIQYYSAASHHAKSSPMERCGEADHLIILCGHGHAPHADHHPPSPYLPLYHGAAGMPILYDDYDHLLPSMEAADL